MRCLKSGPADIETKITGRKLYFFHFEADRYQMLTHQITVSLFLQVSSAALFELLFEKHFCCCGGFCTARNSTDRPKQWNNSVLQMCNTFILAITRLASIWKPRMQKGSKYEGRRDLVQKVEWLGTSSCLKVKFKLFSTEFVPLLVSTTFTASPRVCFSNY